MMLVNEREEGSAAIASAGAAQTYDAQILASGIEDDPQNYTRFWLLGRDAEGITTPKSANKTSIVFTLENRTGSLFRALAVFALRDIDLTKIESRPLVGRPWEYIFYLDFMGNTAEDRVRSALAHLEEFAAGVKVLGCYVSAQREEGG
jgi:prephenate dehydratase